MSDKWYANVIQNNGVKSPFKDQTNYSSAYSRRNGACQVYVEDQKLVKIKFYFSKREITFKIFEDSSGG